MSHSLGNARVRHCIACVFALYLHAELRSWGIGINHSPIWNRDFDIVASLQGFGVHIDVKVVGTIF